MPTVVPGSSAAPSFGDYAGLQSAIATWAHRSDLANVADFIALAESRLYDLMVLRDMEVEQTLSTTVGNNYVGLPDNYISPIALWLILPNSSNYRQLLEPVEPEDLPYLPNQIRPQYWAIDGDNIRLDAPADQVYSLPFRFVKRANLSDSATTNYLLLSRPDIYLAACMVEVGLFLKDASMLATWEPKLESSVREFRNRDRRNRKIAPLRVDSALARPRQTFNIYRGE